MRGKQDHSRERNLRRQQTDAEFVIWQCLRSRRLHECKFRRQHRVGPLFLDFECLELGLIVELDGSQHLESAQQHADGLRTLYLEKLGYRVLRFWNDEVCATLTRAWTRYQEWCRPLTRPSATLSPQVGRGTHKRHMSFC